jgi:hypothetical protein
MTKTRSGKSRSFVDREEAVQAAFDLISRMAQAFLSFGTYDIEHSSFSRAANHSERGAVRDDDPDAPNICSALKTCAADLLRG